MIESASVTLTSFSPFSTYSTFLLPQVPAQNKQGSGFSSVAKAAKESVVMAKTTPIVVMMVVAMTLF